MVRGAQLDSPHRDPFDRMLAGQALVEGCAMVTADAAFRTMGVDVVW
jgi:PIN domain nuclease of toxin-antitoxin system